MSDFIIGPIKIVDDGDGVYEAPAKDSTPIDDIQDLQGHSVLPTGKEAQQALKQLGISSLTGLRLSPASRYLSLLGQARNYATAGNTLKTQDSIREAREAARLAGLPFSEKRAEETLKTCLQTELDSLMKEAPLLADQGKIAALQDTLNAARDVLMRLGVLPEEATDRGLPYSPDLAEHLEKTAYGKAMIPLWEQAKKSAKDGNVLKTLETTRLYREYALRSEAGVTQDQEKEIEQITQLAYRQAIPVYLEKASSVAKTGDVEKTRSILSETREAAVLSGKPLKKKQKKQITRIERLALKNSPLYLFQQAQAAAQAGDVAETRRLIQQARDYRLEAGLPLEKKQEKTAQALENTALLASVDLLLSQASGLVSKVKKNGDMNPLRQLIIYARENARLIGGDFTAAQAASAEKILKEGTEAAVEWRFGQATNSAKLGKVDDTIVPLNAARELAHGMGLTFDETRAQHLVTTALLGGIELSFEAAEQFARKGDLDNTYFQLDNARDYARRLKQDFDEERAEKILALLPTTP